MAAMAPATNAAACEARDTARSLPRPGEQWSRIDRETARTELDADLEVDPVARRAAEPVARGDRRPDRERDLAELGDHREVATVIEDHALVEAADRPGVTDCSSRRGHD